MIHEYLPPKDNRPCICRICVCGNHPCPGVTHLRPFAGTTSYHDDYPAKECPLDHSSPRKRPFAGPTKASPGHFQTTNQQTYEPIPNIGRERQSPFKPKDNPRPTAEFQGTTTQRTDYVEHPLEPLKRSNPKLNLPKRPGMGYYETTNQAMQNPVLKAYQDGSLQPQSPSKMPESLHPDHLPFDGKTSYQDHYPPKASELMTRNSPRVTGIPRPPDNRDFLTTNNATYLAPQLKKLLPCPAAVAPRRPPSSDGHIKVLEKIDLEKYATYAAEDS